MNKQTKMLIGVGAVAVVGYFIWKSTQKKPFANLTSNALVNKKGKKKRKKKNTKSSGGGYGFGPIGPQQPQPEYGGNGQHIFEADYGQTPSQTYLAKRRRNK